MMRLLPDGLARESMMQELGAIRVALGKRVVEGLEDSPGAIERVAAITLEVAEEQGLGTKNRD